LKHIGLVGGMSPESTKEYYAILVELARGAFKDGADDPVIIIYSINLAAWVAHVKDGRRKEAFDLLAHAISMLHGAGAELVALTANTPHMFFDDIQGRSPVPMVSIVRATCDRAKEMGVKRPLLLGTRHTMASDMYPKALAKKGIAVVIPDEKEQETIDKAIRGELTKGIFESATKKRFIAIGNAHIQKDGADSVILGCTEIPLLLKDGDLPVPLLNTTRIHAEAIFKAAWTKADDRARRP